VTCALRGRAASSSAARSRRDLSIEGSVSTAEEGGLGHRA
jgi:hypothetical protein